MIEKLKKYEKIDFLGEGQVYILLLFELIIELIFVLLIAFSSYDYKIFLNFQFATVYKAKDIDTDKIVAVKKVFYYSSIFRYTDTQAIIIYIFLLISACTFICI